jgi:hypothetical protein
LVYTEYLFCQALLMTLNPKNIFLLDSSGALISVLLTAFILPQFSDLLGLSLNVLSFLATLAFVCMTYSFCCYSFVKQIKRWMLMAIILANVLYCVISGGLIFLYDPITKIGSALLMCEILVISVLVGIELKVLNANRIR